MKKETLLKIIAPPALLCTAVIWGIAFVVVKKSLDSIPAVYMLAFRFSIAAVFLAPFFVPALLKAGKKTWIDGMIAGALLFGAYATQTAGAKYTTAGNSAFLTSLYVVLVPLLTAFMRRRKPDLLDTICAVTAITGIGFMSLSSFSFNVGDALTVACSLFFALHIIALAAFTKKDDIGALTVLQFVFAALLSWALAPIAEGAPPFASLNGEMIWNIVFLGVVSSGIAYFFQSFGQKYTKAAASAVLLSSESAFGAFFGWLLLHETMTPAAVFGAALMFIAIVSGQTRLSFIPPLAGLFADKEKSFPSKPDGTRHLSPPESDDSANIVAKALSETHESACASDLSPPQTQESLNEPEKEQR